MKTKQVIAFGIGPTPDSLGLVRQEDGFLDCPPLYFNVWVERCDHYDGQVTRRKYRRKGPKGAQVYMHLKKAMRREGHQGRGHAYDHSCINKH